MGVASRCHRARTPPAVSTSSISSWCLLEGVTPQLGYGRPWTGLCPKEPRTAPHTLARSTVGLLDPAPSGGGAGDPESGGPLSCSLLASVSLFSLQVAPVAWAGTGVSEPPGQAAQGWAGLPAWGRALGLFVQCHGPPLGRSAGTKMSHPCSLAPVIRGPGDTVGWRLLGRKPVRGGCAGVGRGLLGRNPLQAELGQAMGWEGPSAVGPTTWGRDPRS